jgi:5-methylcytosine-specific restriction protein A
LAIGREVGELKENPTKNTKGGNRFKRILMHSPIISIQHWGQIASGTSEVNLFGPTPDTNTLDVIVSQLLKKGLEKPKGNKKPKQSNISTTAYYRDPLVKAWVLINANGTCEVCSSPAPFEKNDGLPFLDVNATQNLRIFAESINKQDSPYSVISSF